MKKLIITLVIALAACSSASAQFFWGIQFGFYTDNGTTAYENNGAKIKGGTTFNYSLKPSVGYYITDRLVVGSKFVYTKNHFGANDTYSKSTTIWNYALNLLMGNGLATNCMTFKVQPYIRYKALSMFTEKLNFWVELNGYIGGNYDIDVNTNKIVPGSGKLTYGVLLHPMVSFDIADKWMLFTSVDALSLGWDGTTGKSQYKLDDGTYTTETVKSNAFLFQCNPLVAVARCFTNIGVIKKF